ncbi:MAG: hypothetical protein M1823_000226 [Watsoniomyces obsoletus]|nr:MAG: hypothetical protein M1823_000226 [Watsoniomyces obsoletus]
MSSRRGSDFVNPPPPNEAPPPLPPGPPPANRYPPVYRFKMGQHQVKSEFTFRSNTAAPMFPQQQGPPPSFGNDNDRPRDSRRHRPIQHQKGRKDMHSRRDLPDRRPFYNKMPADRPLLRSNRAATPEQLAGMTEEHKKRGRFLRAEDVSDSDEQEMEVDSPTWSSKGEENLVPVSQPQTTEDDTAEPRRKKRARKDKQHDETVKTETPKWSNPDPYTALPPADEPQRKRKDVVKLIRKARVEAARSGDSTNVIAATDDFISLNFDEDSPMNGNGDSESDTSDDTRRVRDQAPRGPRAGRHNQIPTDGARAPGSAQLTLVAGSLGAPPPHTDPALGNRKRTHDDEIKSYPAPQTSQKLLKFLDGGLLPQWDVPIDTPVPWGEVDHSKTANMGFWLHKEMCDFYAYARPREYERFMREDLINRVRAVIQSAHPDCDVRCFGSFPAGIYLPTSDMDMVIVSEGFLKTGKAKEMFGRKGRHLFIVANLLRANGLCEPDSVEVISKAKVPLVKFVDRLTGIRVDLSTENTTGIVAIETCRAWKEQFPALPLLVMVIKQFLGMRGMSEVRTGGLGGFAVTCMVTSLLQNMPQVQSGSMIPEEHLGEILMEFFDLYGHRFNIANTGIRLDPPGYFEKSLSAQLPYHVKSDRISIEDPNRADNDLSVGTTNIRGVMKLFGRAYDDMHRQMLELRDADLEERKGESILWTILRGNYTSYAYQRNRLRVAYEQRTGETVELHERDLGVVPDLERIRCIQAELDSPLPTIIVPQYIPVVSEEAMEKQKAAAIRRRELHRERLPELDRRRAKKLKEQYPHMKDTIPDSLSVKELKKFRRDHLLVDKKEKKKILKQRVQEERRVRKLERRKKRQEEEAKKLLAELEDEPGEEVAKGRVMSDMPLRVL